MKKQILFFIAVFLVSILSAQVSTSATNNGFKNVNDKSVKSSPQVKNEKMLVNPQADNPNAPVISFDKVVHDYGNIAYKGNGNCAFIFTNEGKEPLILSNVRSSCGCTVPEWPKGPVMPGQSAAIKVEYDTKKTGSFKKNIYVSSNAKNQKVTLTVQGTVEPNPAQLKAEN